VSFGRTTSGVWIADTGPRLIDAVAAKLAADPQVAS
jgi:hypothetical protein